MKRSLFTFFFLGFLSLNVFAQTEAPKFVILPNTMTQYLMSVDATKALSVENKAIDLVRKTLDINSKSPYQTVRIRMVYNKDKSVAALIVYLLSNKTKSVELIRINLNNDFTVKEIIQPYELQESDLAQSPNFGYVGTCPDNTVQFVIGNSFRGYQGVEREVQGTYQLAKEKGYNPYLMTVNDPSGPQPTVKAYKDWMSCPNVKGFYNESHGWSRGIVLSDDDFTYTHVKTELVDKLKDQVILFDSCQTFHDPLLSSIVGNRYGNAQQYIAGFISLPFGASERTATCIWKAAFAHQELNKALVQQCSRENDLEEEGYDIGGNGDVHLRPSA